MANDVGSLIRSSLRLINAIAVGQTPTAAEMQDALEVLNDILENLSIEELGVWSVNNQVFNFQPGKSTYTIGPGGDFDTERPLNLNGAFCNWGGVDFPIIPWTLDEYNRLSLKTLPSQVPNRVVYVNDYPLGLMIFWPVPNQGGTVSLSIPNQLARQVSLATQLAYPPGYRRMLRYQLAVHLAAEFGAPLSSDVASIAADAKGDVKRSNMTPAISQFDGVLIGDDYVSWRAGEI